MFVIDSHCDSIQKTDGARKALNNGYNFSNRCPHLQFVAMFAGWPKEDAKQAYTRGAHYFGQYIMRTKEENLVRVEKFADLERAFNEGKSATLLSVEGGTCYMGDLRVFREFYNAGVRVSGLCWDSNDMAKSNRESPENDTGLSELGRSFVEEGNKLGMIFDVSHMSDKSFWDVAALSEKPIVATHSNFRSLASHSRNLTDDMAKEIIRQGGMIGLNLCTAFVDDHGPNMTVQRLLDHLDHCIELGGEDCIGFGCDIDGIDGLPAPLNFESSIHDQIIDAMKARGYADELIEKVAWKNWYNFLKKNLD